MGLNLDKLENVKEGVDGAITARCPACAANGGDTKGDHLIVYQDGGYGCVANQGDDGHSKEIYALVGDGRKRDQVLKKITVNEFKPPESKVLMDLGRYGRFFQRREE